MTSLPPTPPEPKLPDPSLDEGLRLAIVHRAIRAQQRFLEDVRQIVQTELERRYTKTEADALLADKADSTDLDSYVAKALFDANTVLAADSDDTPAALTVGEDRLVGRLTGGQIAALTAAQFKTLVGLDDGALDLYCQDLRVKGNFGVYDTVPISQPTGLTAKDTQTVDATYGSEEADVINNNRTRIEEIETRMKNWGFLP